MADDPIGSSVTQAQWRGLLRFVLTSAGAAVVSHGLMSSDHWSAIAPYLETIIGAGAMAGSLIWNWISHSPSGIAKHLQQLRQ